MKKLMMTLVAMLTIAASGKAMSYEQARNEALFLTDKMAYELNLTDEQYEAAYEINLDYLMGVTSYDNVFGTYWERRNLDLSYVLLDWQWELFRAATYFYRPLYWEGGYWHFGIYARYPYRDYFYFGRPVFYASYRGGHAWHRHGAHGYYYSHRDHYHGHHGRSHFGMLDRWNRGDYRHSSHHHGDRGHDRNGGYRNSSTRTTVNGHHGRPGNGTNTRPGGEGRPNSGGSFGGYRDHNSTTGGSRPSTDIRPSTSHARPERSTLSSRPERSTMTVRSDRSTMTSRPSTSIDRSSHSSGSFSRSGSSSNFSRSNSSHSSGSFSRGDGGMSHSSGSFSRGGGGGSHSGGGHSGGGGRSFGGRR